MLWSFDAYSKDVATCDKLKDKQTKIEVNFFDVPVSIVDSYPFDGLKERRKKNFYRYKTDVEDVAWISDLDVSIGGYYRAGIGADIGYGFSVIPYKGQPNLSCVFVDYIKVDLYLNGTVFIDPYYKDIECRDYKDRALDILKEKNSLPLGEVVKSQEKLRKTLPDILSKMEKFAVKSSVALEKVEKIKKSLKDGVEKYPISIKTNIAKIYTEYEPPSDLVDAYSSCTEKVKEHKKYKSLNVDKGQGYRYME